jgi:hypothetical protein
MFKIETRTATAGTPNWVETERAHNRLSAKAVADRLAARGYHTRYFDPAYPQHVFLGNAEDAR